jgi:hypothetical protein
MFCCCCCERRRGSSGGAWLCVYNTIASRLPKGQNSITKPNGVIHYIHINQNAHTQTQTYELFLPFPIMEQCLDVMESTTLYPKENDKEKQNHVF